MAMTLRLEDDLDRRLSELAERAGISKQKLVVIAIEEHLARERQNNFAASVVDKVLTRDRELLERLSVS